MTATLKRKSPKEPSVEQLAKQAARGPRFFQKPMASGHVDPSLADELRKSLQSRALRLANLAQAGSVDVSEEDKDFLFFAGSGGGRLGLDAGDITRLQCLFERHAKAINGKNGHAVPHPASTGNSTPAGIIANDPSVTGETTESVRGNGKAKRETKPAKPETAAAAGSTPPSERETLGPVVKLNVGNLVRHSANRKVSGEAIDERAESMKERGQLEPIIVRALDDEGHLTSYQILSGETRWLAARKLKWTEVEARIRVCSDAEALELVAEANGQRQDLNPIERAQLIEQLCKPVPDGGAGLTKDVAAKRVGLNDGSSASNLVRLLKLPKVWRDRVAGGELPESFARLIVPICHAPRLIEVLEETWKRDKAGRQHQYSNHWAGWDSRDKVEQLVERIVGDCTRPLGKEKHNYRSNQFKTKGHNVWDYTGEHPRRFELTPEVEKTLDVVELTIDDKPVRMATNIQAYDKLQIPAIVAHVDKNRKGKAAKAGADTPAPKKELTPAEKKANAKKQSEQLQARINGWRHDWLKSLVATSLCQGYTDPRLPLRILISLAIDEINPPHFKFQRLPAEVAQHAGTLGARSKDPWLALAQISHKQDWLESTVCALTAAAVMTEDNDNRFPVIAHKRMNELAEMAGIDLAIAWDKLQDDHETTRLEGGDGDCGRFAEFFELFQTAQLDELGEELGVHLVHVNGKAAKIKLLTTRDRALKLPKCIKPLSVPGKRQAKSSTAKRGK